MGLKERVQELCKRKGVTSQQAEIDLEFAKGSISKLNANLPTSKKLQKMAEYFNVTVDYIVNGEQSEENNDYYLNDETAKFAQEVFEKDRVLFDVYRSDSKEKLVEYAKMLKAMKELEEGGN